MAVHVLLSTMPLIGLLQASFLSVADKHINKWATQVLPKPFDCSICWIFFQTLLLSGNNYGCIYTAPTYRAWSQAYCIYTTWAEPSHAKFTYGFIMHTSTQAWLQLLGLMSFLGSSRCSLHQDGCPRDGWSYNSWRWRGWKSRITIKCSITMANICSFSPLSSMLMMSN